MRAVVRTRYGSPDVLKLQDVAKPVPENNEVLVRVYATTVCAADWRLRKPDPFFVRLMTGLIRPKKMRILGMEFSGTVESVGAAVTGFKAGDAVFGSTWFRFGTYAEYVCLSDKDALELKPANMSFEQAAAVFFGGISALSFLRKAKVQAGQHVLVYGASGSVGVFAVQLAKHMGARVTGVCSTANLELVRNLGADAVIDYTRDDYSRAGRAYDVVLDTVGKAGYRRALSCLRRGGTFAMVAGSLLGSTVGAKWCALTGGPRIAGGVASAEPGDTGLLKRLIEEGKLKTVIDRCYPLDEIADAHRYVECGHKKGHVVILVQRQPDQR